MTSRAVHLRSAPPTPKLALLNPLRPIALLWRERELVRQLTARETRQAYRESVLGAVWTLAQPLLSLAVYTFVFTVVFTPRAPEGSVSRPEFVVDLFCGLITFWVFSESASRAPALVVNRPSYVKNVVFPLEALSVSTLGASLVYFGAGLAVLLVATGVVHGHVSPTLVALPLALAPLVLLTLGVSWFLSSLGVFLRDVQPAMRAVVQLLFFMTPIVWSVELLPGRLRPFALLNPLAAIVEGTRATAVHGAWPDWTGLGLAWAFALATFVLGHAWFARTKRGFADVL